MSDKQPDEKPISKKMNVPPELIEKIIDGEITLGQFAGLSEEVLYSIADIAYNSLEVGHADKALPLYKGLVAASPLDSVFHCHLAATYYALNELDQAFEHYSSAIQFNNSNVDALTGRGEIYLHRKQPALAINDFKAAIEADSQCNRRSTMRARAALSMLAQAAGISSEQPDLSPEK